VDIVIDTREQCPWAFPPELATVRRGTLSAGDYALLGDDGFAIERKSFQDYVSTITAGWERFARELYRMEALLFPARVIIVEGTAMEIVGREYKGDAHPKFVIKRTAQLIMDGCCVLFADNSTTAAGMAYAIFKERRKAIDGNFTSDSATVRDEGLLLQERDGMDDSLLVPDIGSKLYRKRRGELRAFPRDGFGAHGGIQNKQV
jgi:ERCC4-type nuclease